MASLNDSTGSKDQYYDLINKELVKDQPLKETDLLTRLEQHNVLPEDVRDCLNLMEKKGSICKTAASENIWKLVQGDFTQSSGQSVTQPEKNILEPEPIRQTYSSYCGHMEALTAIFKSVGHITGGKGTGTCFRVGNDKIITAAHVVNNSIWDTVLNKPYIENLKTFTVDFNYIGAKSSPIFKVEPKLMYMDQSMDIAVLQLKPHDQMSFPPAIKKFVRLDPDTDEHKEIYLIGHDQGERKKFNAGIGIWNPTSQRLKDLKKICMDYGKEDGYKDIDRKDRLVIKCEFASGASGSPGIVISNNVAYVAFVYIRGFPDFYYNQQFPDEERKKFPSDKLLQQGVNIGNLFDTISEKKEYLELYNEIFPEQAEKQHQDKQSSQYNEKDGHDKWTVDDLSAEIGNISLDSSTKEETVTSSSLSIPEILKKIIAVFDKPDMNLKPKDVAQKSGLGQTRKDVNKYLYCLERKGVLTVTTSDGKDPRWNKKYPPAQYSDKDLHKWAAEIK